MFTVRNVELSLFELPFLVYLCRISHIFFSKSFSEALEYILPVFILFLCVSLYTNRIEKVLLMPVYCVNFQGASREFRHYLRKEMRNSSIACNP